MIAVAAGLVFAAVLSLATARPLRAENAVQSQTINLNAGQTQIIDHLKKDSKPAIRVIENPHALVIHGETPGQLVLLGAERGQWEVTVTRDDGAQVAYHVNVAAIADSSTPLDPATGPIASSDATFPRNLPRIQPTAAAPRRPCLRMHVVDAFSSDAAPHTRILPQRTTISRQRSYQ